VKPARYIDFVQGKARVAACGDLLVFDPDSLDCVLREDRRECNSAASPSPVTPSDAPADVSGLCSHFIFIKVWTVCQMI